LRDDSTTTLSEAFDTFKRTHTAKNRISTSKETERLIERHLITRLGDTPLAGITTTEIAGIIDKLHKTPGTAFHLFAAARLFFRWAVKRRLLGRSPIDGLPAPSAPQSRDRVLSSAELTTVFRASDDGSIFGAIIRLLILSGQRRSQIAALRGEYIDRDKRIITWPASAMKANQPHAIPITPMITGVLRDLPREGYVFPARGKETPFNGFSKSKQSFDKKLEGVNPYVIHDLRRSVASGLQSLGVPIAHTEALLAHRSGSFAGIVAVYQRHSYLPEMKAALEAWETHLSSLLKSE
jgi:integrase